MVEQRFKVLVGLAGLYGFAVTVLGASQGVLFFNSYRVNFTILFMIAGGLLVEFFVMAYLWKTSTLRLTWGLLNLVFLAVSMVASQIAHSTLYPVFTGNFTAPFIVFTIFSWFSWFLAERNPADYFKQVLSSVKHSRRWQYVIGAPFLAYLASRLPTGDLRVALAGLLLFSTLPVAVWKIESKKEASQE